LKNQKKNTGPGLAIFTASGPWFLAVKFIYR
jgi:hypothetical protein